MGRTITLELPISLKSRLSQGHPWVYRDQVLSAPDLSSGTWVQVRCGSFAAFGLWDAVNPIAVRLFSQQKVPDSNWVADRVAEAWQVRASVRASATSATRAISASAMPG